MSLTLRNVKGSPLTYTEMDNNLTYLEGVAGATGGTGILDDLVVSGTSSLGDVVIADGKVINAENGGGQLNLREYDTDGIISLNNNGSFGDGEYLYMEPTYIELSSVPIGGSRVNLFADEYGAGIGLGDAGGIQTGDFSTYGKNGFSIENRTIPTEEALNIKHDDFINITSNSKTDITSNGGIRIISDDPTFGYQAILMSFGEVDISSDNSVSLSCGIQGVIVDAVNVTLGNGLNVIMATLPTYANNADAITGGLTVGTVYKTSGGEVRVVV